MQKTLRFLAAAGLIGGGCWVASAWGQQPRKVPADSLEPVSVEPIRDKVKIQSDGPLDPASQPEGKFKRPVEEPLPAEEPMVVDDVVRHRKRKATFAAGEHASMGSPVSIEEVQQFNDAVEKLKAAKEGPDKDAAKKELLGILDRSFTHDLEHREQEVAEIEARVQKLREQIERRKKAKDEIVGLRLKTIVNATEGLDFPFFQYSGPQMIKRESFRRPAVQMDQPFQPRPSSDFGANPPDNTRCLGAARQSPSQDLEIPQISQTFSDLNFLNRRDRRNLRIAFFCGNYGMLRPDRVGKSRLPVSVGWDQ